MTKLSNDSTLTIKGIIYQFLVALDKCFELQEGQSVYIETHGDVSILGKGSEQIESKFYKGFLTELDHNIWKTLNNWINDDFDIDKFNSLILLTTQKVRVNSTWHGWNNKSKNEKLKILLDINTKHSIRSKKSKETKAFLNYILEDSRRQKLIKILDKFYIDHNAIDDKEYYKQIKNRNTTHLRAIRSDQYMHTLFGYILSPQIIDNKWEISYEGFREECINLTSVLTESTKVFPEKVKLDNIKYEEYLENTFVEKIKEINYDDVLIEAITDFAETRELVLKEFRYSPTISKSLKRYGEDIKKKHKAKYRKASRKVELGNQIEVSQDFYDEIISSDSGIFHIFNTIPQDFYIGMLHMIADEEEEFIWLLNSNNNV